MSEVVGSKESESDVPEEEILITEYEQAGEEIRYRDQILHNSYYLMAITFGVFLTALLSNLESNLAVTVISIAAGLVFLAISAVVEMYMRRREAAMVRREDIEEQVNGFGLQSGIYQEPYHAGKGRHEKNLFESLGPHSVVPLVLIQGFIWIGIGIYTVLSEDRLIIAELLLLVTLLLVLYYLRKSRTGDYFYANRLF